MAEPFFKLKVAYTRQARYSMYRDEIPDIANHVKNRKAEISSLYLA